MSIKSNQISGEASSQANPQVMTHDVMEGIKAFCAVRLNHREEITTLSKKISNLDNQRKMYRTELMTTMKKNKWNKIQIKSSQSTLPPIQVQIKKIHSYDVPSYNMISNTPCEWDQIIKYLQNPHKHDDTVSYLYKNIQEARRTSKEYLTIKKCGKRSEKKLLHINHSTQFANGSNSSFNEFENQIVECFKLNNDSIKLRGQKRKFISSSDENYRLTLQYLKNKGVRAQTFNLKPSKAGEPTKKLLLRRVRVGHNKMLSAKVLKSLIEKSLVDLRSQSNSSNFETKKVKHLFIEIFMNKLYDYQQQKSNMRERLVYELQ
tara:strand:+ start:2360 stop:3316 length:957 start_codon:yes stop_codon:yes gene_type:complete